MKRDPVVIIIVAMVVSLMLVLGIQLTRHNPNAEAASVDNMKGLAAPEFTLPATDGKSVHLSDYRGKAVLLNFWATWCQPCRIEMPWFVELQKRYGSEGLQVVGVSMDDPGSEKDVEEFAQQLGVNYPILVAGKDKDSVGNAYGGVPFLPATFYIDRDGKVLEKNFGLKGRGEIEDSIKKILASGTTARK